MSIWQILIFVVFIGMVAFIFMPINQDVREQAIINPWKRYFARMIDLALYTTLSFMVGLGIGVIAAFTSVDEPTMDFVSILIGIGILIIIEPIILSNYQTTLGKKLYKLKINFSEPVTFNLAMKRWIGVLIRMIPLLSLSTVPRSYRVLKKTGDTAYDRKLGITVTSEKLTAKNITLIAFAIVLAVIINGVSNIAMRDDLTDSIFELSEETLTIQEELDLLIDEVKGEMTLPQMIDDNTELYDLGTGDMRLIYYYQFPNYKLDELDIDFFLEVLRTDLKVTQLEYYCKNESMLWYRMNDIAVVYRYSSADNLVVGENIHYSWECL